MYRVFVSDKEGKPSMPCSPARARRLLRLGRARVVRIRPFAIILDEHQDLTQPLELKIDPGSRKTGFALVGDFQNGRRVLFAMNLEHKGVRIRRSLEKRRAVRRSRRARNTRYRKPRFLNRTRSAGWLPPSLRSRVDNVVNWAKKLRGFSPVTEIMVETAKFDTMKMQNPEVSGAEYQQGELYGYEVREYLLEKWGRQCIYCDVKNVPWRWST